MIESFFVDESKKVVVQVLRAPVGGIRKHVVAIVEALENSPIFEWYWVTSTEPEDIDEGFKSFLESLPTTSKHKIIPLKINDKPELRDIKNILKIRGFLRNKSVQIIHGHGAKGGVYARLLGPVLRAKVIYTPHGGSLHDMFGKLKGFVYSMIEKILYPFTDLFVFESRYTQNQFYKKVINSSKKAVLNLNGIKVPELTSKAVIEVKETDRWILSSFGALRYIKGHDLIVGALPLLLKEGVDCEYRIYGEGEERQNLIDQAKALGVEDRLKILSKTKEVLTEMEKSHLILQPSRHESFGYVPLEAMSVKRPLIASSRGGLVEVVDHEQTGLLVKELHSSAFAGAILRMVREPLLRESLVEEGYRVVTTKFSEEKMLAQLLKIYNQIDS